MSGFTREIKVYPAYDYRDDANDQRGAHGAQIVLILTGDLGVVVARLSTGWVERPLRWRMGAPGPQDRRPQPGVDGLLTEHYPFGAGVFAHCPEPHGEHWSGMQDACEYLDGAPCYTDGSFMASDDVIHQMVTGGSDAAFVLMESIYQAWIADETVDE